LRHEPAKVGFLPFIARELGAYALHEALGARGRRPRVVPAHGRTIVLVHGHGGTAAAFHLLEERLARRGHRRFAAFEYTARGSVSDLAADLARWAEASLDGEVHVIGHSLGGVLARVWLQEHGGRALARSLVTLSTPHQGLAPLPGASLLPVVREIVAGSPLLERLDATASVLQGLPCLSLVSTRDHFVRPWQNAGFPGARLVPVEDAGHVGLLFSRRVHGLVASHLSLVE
jgi:hypothetical protein